MAPEVGCTRRAALAGALLVSGRSTGQPALPVVRFAAIADVQYADQPAQGPREYRASVTKLREAVGEINRRGVDFVIQLGDLVDGGRDNLSRILPVYGNLRAARFHVLGNHDFVAERAEVLRLFGLRRAYYDFAAKGWRFLVLDGMDLSVAGWARASSGFGEAQILLESLKAASAPNAVEWNGGLGRGQQRWLADALREAERRGERVIVFCHFPVLEASSTPVHLLWNYGEVLEILKNSPVVAAYLNGHDHRGGYAQADGIHFVTLEGMVESGSRNGYAIVEVFPERIEIEGFGAVTGRTLRFDSRAGRPGPSPHLSTPG